MFVDLSWQCVLENWASAAQRFAIVVADNGVLNCDDPWCDDYRGLNEKMRHATLQEIDAFPFDSFGAIGDVICVLKPEASVWLLPILLRFGSVSQEPIYARSVIDALRQEISKIAKWSDTKRMISPNTRDRLYELARACCELGWQDEKRALKRAMECKEILF
jgi:hypothetical protein